MPFIFASFRKMFLSHFVFHSSRCARSRAFYMYYPCRFQYDATFYDNTLSGAHDSCCVRINWARTEQRWTIMNAKSFLPREHSILVDNVNVCVILSMKLVKKFEPIKTWPQLTRWQRKMDNMHTATVNIRQHWLLPRARFFCGVCALSSIYFCDTGFSDSRDFLTLSMSPAK